MGFNNPASPVEEYRTIITDSGTSYTNRLLVGTATTGIIRIEWHQARAGQLVPPNLSMVQMLHYMNSFIPLRYQVADAQNLIVKEAIEKEFEWLLLWEHDVIPQPDALVTINQYIQEEEWPVVSGLYYTRSHPTEPLIYRGRGTSAYLNWNLGDLVTCDGVPTGFLLVHCGLLKEMYHDSEEYAVGGHKLRRVFETPLRQYYDPEKDGYFTLSGTSDLEWCTRLVQGGYFKRAGWDKFEGAKYPFLVDTGKLFCRHCNIDGTMFPDYSWERIAYERAKRQQALTQINGEAPEADGDKGPELAGETVTRYE